MEWFFLAEASGGAWGYGKERSWRKEQFPHDLPLGNLEFTAMQLPAWYDTFVSYLAVLLYRSQTPWTKRILCVYPEVSLGTNSLCVTEEMFWSRNDFFGKWLLLSSLLWHWADFFFGGGGGALILRLWGSLKRGFDETLQRFLQRYDCRSVWLICL